MVIYILQILAVVILVGIASKKIKLPMPILLVASGIAMSYIPNINAVEIVPEIVLLIFLPPLLFADAWMIPKREFMLYKRPISLLAVGLVIATTFVIGHVTHYLIPSIPLSMCFVLGAIVSPTDAVAVLSIIEHLKIPKSINIILRGESLINDASGLVAFKFAVAAALTGHFSATDAVKGFLISAVGAATIGFTLAYCLERALQYLKEHKISDHYIEASVSLLTPFIAYLMAEHLHLSGVIAAVIAGFYSGWKDLKDLSYNNRTHLKTVWETLIFLLNGMMFVLLGLQLPFILEPLPIDSIGQYISCAIIIFAVMLTTRIAWVFSGAYIPRFLFPKLRRMHPDLKPSHVFLIGWGGIRGTITVVAAFAIPITPNLESRSIVILLAFVITMCSLLIQGLSMLHIINKLGVNQIDGRSNASAVRIALASAAVDKISQTHGNSKIAQNIINYYKGLITQLQNDKNNKKNDKKNDDYKLLNELRKISTEAEKTELARLYKIQQIDEELFKELREELDLKLRPYS